jgi:hypothetical protein
MLLNRTGFKNVGAPCQGRDGALDLAGIAHDAGGLELANVGLKNRIRNVGRTQWFFGNIFVPETFHRDLGPWRMKAGNHYRTFKLLNSERSLRWSFAVCFVAVGTTTSA